jgi:hypothetical protein
VGVGVSEGIGVAAGVSVIVGVNVIVGVRVTVGLGVADGVGGNTAYAARFPPTSIANAPAPMRMPTRIRRQPDNIC